jgi:2-phospho-L-lactate/phosphoenolpyruvate guanylyltransferase
LIHTLEQVVELADIADIYVISKSSEVLAEAERRNLIGCLESRSCDLNGAIALGARRAQAAGATEVMVVPIDIPSLTSKRMRTIIDEYSDARDVIVITDRAGDGTNVMLWRPIETASFQYGIGSASRHAEAARSLGLRVTVRKDEFLSFDLDTAEDLDLWLGSDEVPDSFAGRIRR